MNSGSEAELRRGLILASALIYTQPPRDRARVNCFRVLRHALDAAGLWNARLEERQPALFHGNVEDPVVRQWYSTLIELARQEPASDRLLEGAGDLDTPAGAYFTACWLTPAGKIVAKKLLAAHPEWTERLTGQPIPSVSRADVERVVRRDYPPEQRARAMAILDTYGSKSWQRERDRVQLAALKLAGGSLDALSKLLDSPDYRDLLLGAEYPGYMMNSPMYRLPLSERQRIVNEDWAQYMQWLNRQ